MENHCKKILVTGALGLIGNKLANQLSRNFSVTGIDNKFRPNENVEINFSFIETSVNDFVKTSENFYDYIFHFSAINGTKYFYEMPNQLIENNVCSDLKIFNYAKINNSKVVYASTSEIVADTEIIPTAEECNVRINDIHNPRWSYRLGKMLSENYLVNSNLDFLIFRFFNIYGKESKSGHFIFDIVEKIKNKNFTITGSNETRSFCHIDDAVDAMINVFAVANKEVINIGTGEEISIYDAVKIISNYYNLTTEWKVEDGLRGSVKRRSPSINKLLYYYPDYSPVSFKEGIKKVLKNEKL